MSFCPWRDETIWTTAKTLGVVDRYSKLGILYRIFLEKWQEKQIKNIAIRQLEKVINAIKQKKNSDFVRKISTFWFSKKN